MNSKKIFRIINKILTGDDVPKSISEGTNEICQSYDLDRASCYIRISKTDSFVLLHDCKQGVAPKMHIEKNGLDFDKSYCRSDEDYENDMMKLLIKEKFLHIQNVKEYEPRFTSVGFHFDTKRTVNEMCVSCIASYAVGMMGYFVFERFEGKESFTEDEVQEIEKLSELMVERIVNFEIAKKLQEEEINKKIDKLTGLPIFKSFVEEASKLIQNGNPYVMVYMDIDKFKYINDIWSFSTGNEILVEFSKLLASLVDFDKELCCRIDGDKFGLFLQYAGDKDLSRRIKDLDARIQELQQKKFSDIKITMIGGVYILQEDTSINLVIDKANIARRTIKGSYKNDFKIYNENLENINEREKQLEKRMGPALENGEFVPFLQPKFNLQTNTICGAEALARWKAKDRMIAPFEFIPAFERNGFITKLDFSIYDQVFRFMSKMLKEGRTLFPISLNVSRGHMSNPCFVEEVVALLKTYEIPHELVELEITESVFTEDKMLLKTFISEIRSYGMQVSIDDFGTAYSSLNLLKDVVVDVIKMDKSFVHDDVEDTEESIKSNKIIVKNIVNMIKELNFKIIFEGIETKEHVEFLSGIGCRYGQGYVFARPMPLEEFKSTYLQ